MRARARVRHTPARWRWLRLQQSAPPLDRGARRAASTCNASCITSFSWSLAPVSCSLASLSSNLARTSSSSSTSRLREAFRAAASSASTAASCAMLRSCAACSLARSCAASGASGKPATGAAWGCARVLSAQARAPHQPRAASRRAAAHRAFNPTRSLVAVARERAHAAQPGTHCGKWGCASCRESPPAPRAGAAPW